jgi:serine/threonine protein kinase
MPRDPRLPEPGAIIAGKYRVARIVGEGGMGVVYEAMHVKMKQRVALKMLLPETLELPDVVARFEREARASGQLRSRHTARVMDVDQTEEGLPYIVMEYLEGHDLGTEIDTRGKVPYAEAVDYVLQACVAIAEAHDVGIVHRDLKPSNLFLSTGPDGVLVKLLDFGISKVTTEADKLTAAESVMGTPLYMSPEQVRSARNVDARTDVWSLGVILYELIAGDTPFSGTTTQVAAAVVMDDVPPILTNHGAPAALQDVVLHALRRDFNYRYQSARELASALLPFASSQSTGVLAIEALLSSGRGSAGGLQPPPQSGTPAWSQQPGPVRAMTEGDKTVATGPAAVPVQHDRPRTQQNWTRGREKRKGPSAFVLFGVIAVAAATVVGGGALLAARLRGGLHAAAKPSASQPATVMADTASSATATIAPAPVSLSSAAPPDSATVSVPEVASAAAAPSMSSSSKAPVAHAPHAHGPRSADSQSGGAVPQPAHTTSPTTTETAAASAPIIPHHL